jgi:rifampicin phosphotransferase
MHSFVLYFQEIDRSKIMIVGGKGANLGELSGIKGIQVPEGFCLTTAAYKKVTENNQQLNRLLDQLTGLKANERETISEISARVRMTIERLPIPSDMQSKIH